MRAHLLLLGVIVAIPACSDDPPGSSGSGGSSGQSGGSASGGASGLGGGTASGGAAPSGGSTSAGGTAGASGLPSGKVDSCYGDACPFGECDAGGIFEPACSSVYPGPVSPSSMYCAAGASGDYCLVVVTPTTIDYYAITCSAGSASFRSCPIGCGFAQSKATCNT